MVLFLSNLKFNAHRATILAAGQLCKDGGRRDHLGYAHEAVAGVDLLRNERLRGRHKHHLALHVITDGSPSDPLKQCLTLRILHHLSIHCVKPASHARTQQSWQQQTVLARNLAWAGHKIQQEHRFMTHPGIRHCMQ